MSISMRVIRACGFCVICGCIGNMTGLKSFSEANSLSSHFLKCRWYRSLAIRCAVWSRVFCINCSPDSYSSVAWILWIIWRSQSTGNDSRWNLHVHFYYLYFVWHFHPQIAIIRTQGTGTRAIRTWWLCCCCCATGLKWGTFEVDYNEHD